jgi:hypothetical protein
VKIVTSDSGLGKQNKRQERTEDRREKSQKAQRHREIVDCLLRQGVSAASGVGKQRTENRQETEEKRLAHVL